MDNSSNPTSVKTALKLPPVELTQVEEGATNNLPALTEVAADTPAASQPEATRLNLREEFDKRIIQAPVADLPKLIAARGDMLKQDEAVLNGAERRSAARQLFYARIGFSFLATVGGGGLLIGGFAGPGLFAIGAGIAVFVPGYVKLIVKSMRSGRDEDH